MSLAQVYRIKKEPLRLVSRKNDSSKNVSCHPEKLDDRTKRHLIREVHNIRKREPNWTVKSLKEAADIKKVSRRTVSRFLNKNRYNYLQARRKGLMSDKDQRARVAFAKKVVKEHGQTFWTNRIAFYLDGSSSAHKRNPKISSSGNEKASLEAPIRGAAACDVKLLPATKSNTERLMLVIAILTWCVKRIITHMASLSRHSCTSILHLF